MSRERSQSDRRVVHPRLTDAGHDVLAAALPHMHDDFAEAFEAMPEEQRVETGAAFRRIADLMEKLAAEKKSASLPSAQSAGSRRSP